MLIFKEHEYFEMKKKLQYYVLIPPTVASGFDERLPPLLFRDELLSLLRSVEYISSLVPGV